jgi:hypothetical protein
MTKRRRASRKLAWIIRAPTTLRFAASQVRAGCIPIATTTHYPHPTPFLSCPLTGAGKSTAVNALRKARPGDADFAPTHAGVECTAAPAKYPHPQAPYLVLWDVPSGGVDAHPTATYFSDKCLDLYDLLVLCFDGRWSAVNTHIVTEAAKKGTNFVIAFTHTDNYVKSMTREDRSLTRATAFAKIKRAVEADVAAQLALCGVPTLRVPLMFINSYGIRDRTYEFDEAAFIRAIVTSAAARLRKTPEEVWSVYQAAAATGYADASAMRSNTLEDAATRNSSSDNARLFHSSATGGLSPAQLAAVSDSVGDPFADPCLVEELLVSVSVDVDAVQSSYGPVTLQQHSARAENAVCLSDAVRHFRDNLQARGVEHAVNVVLAPFRALGDFAGFARSYALARLLEQAGQTSLAIPIARSTYLPIASSLAGFGNSGSSGGVSSAGTSGEWYPTQRRY